MKEGCCKELKSPREFRKSLYAAEKENEDWIQRWIKTQRKIYTLFFVLGIVFLLVFWLSEHVFP